MAKFQPARMQKRSAQFLCGFRKFHWEASHPVRPIEGVAYNWMTPLRQVNANLMSPSSFNPDAQ
jgi:hypothetical protein